MNIKIYFKFLSSMTTLFLMVFSFYFIGSAKASEIIKYRTSITHTNPDGDPTLYNPVETYGGVILYNTPSPSGASVYVEIDGHTRQIDYTDQIELAVDFWRGIVRDIYPMLTIRHMRSGEEANFLIGYSSALNMLSGIAGREPAISYIPHTGHVNTLALRNTNLAGQYGIYVDNYLAEMNEERMTMMMRTFSDVHNNGEAVKRYMYILLVRHLGYALGFVPEDSNVNLFGNNIPWYSPEIYFVSLNDSATPRLMYRNNTFEYIEDLVRFNAEEDAFSINDIRISPQEEFVARMCLGNELSMIQTKTSKSYNDMCSSKSTKVTYTLIARIISIIN
ncbi:hypothetical protein L7750_19125 [Xenorhabdus bovienii]|uniref:Uncharacterized protein n=1 Tax=Xenorhabdus bovienii str. feltiae Moldova TaxID=1398200 RepID=A0A077NCW4_XENBV|nr:hypothetical protein [Xenorhabdus bovienii]MCG3472403.1 hypothetical protein [Xenorhabdus bovienii]CDH00017.1 exported hypothetical protein [Xenorhabdus bovienii str. feltiae Moldova]